MAIPQPYTPAVSDANREAGANIWDAVKGGYTWLRDADQNLARAINSHMPVDVVFPAPPPGQGSWLPAETPPAAPAPPPIAAEPVPAGPPPHSDLAALSGGGAPPVSELVNSVGQDIRVSRPVQTAGEKRAAAALDQAYAAQEAQAKDVTALKTEKAADLQTQIANENQQLDVNLKAANERRAKEDAAVSAADAYLKSQRDAYAKDGIRSFYANTPKGTASLVASALFTGLGSWAQALGGGPNTAWSVLQNALAHWENSERSRLEQRRELVGMAERDYGRSVEQRAHAEIELKNQRLALLENFERQRLANAAKFGVREEQLAGDATLNQIRQDKAKTQLQIQQGLRATVETSNATQQAIRLATAKAAGNVDKPTGDEKKANAALMKAIPEVQRLRNMPAYSRSDQKAIEAWRMRLEREHPTSWEEFKNLTNSLQGDTLQSLSAEGKRRFMAEMAFGNALLRPETGAVIGKQEFMERIVPMQIFQSDTPDDARAKADRRRVNLESIAALSNRPDYWNQQINGVPAQARRPSPQESAALLKFIRENEGSKDPAIQTKIQAARGVIGGR